MTFTIYIHYVVDQEFNRRVVMIQGPSSDVIEAAQAAWDAFAARPGVTMMTERP